MREYEGVITKISDDAGVAYLARQGSNEQFIFRYAKIDGYSGQSTEELNLKVGRRVNFTLEKDVILSVRLQPQRTE